jgi:small subunit ribosomal protein S9
MPIKKPITTKPKVVKEEKPVEEKPVIVENEIINLDEFVFDTKKKYFETVGRRKNATARVRLYTQNKKGVTVNGKPYQDYFKTDNLQKIIISPLEKLKCQEKFGFDIKVNGGGIVGQAGAVRHAISRVLILLNPYFKKRLKKSGYLTRDSRMRERKKPGLNRARRAPQWSKR